MEMSHLAIVWTVLLLVIPTVRCLPVSVSSTLLLSNGSFRNAEIQQWQRTAFHFQPTKNWMNDPNGPLFYKGFYHLFYQYNPYSAVWGNITWGHAVSTDLLRWSYLDAALVPDQWYDIKGVWSGSATFVKGKPVLLYTGWSNTSTQLQSMAIPKNHSDPLLREWVKPAHNPVVVPPQGINASEFRDPTTAWIGHDGHWRMLIGSKKKANDVGVALLYKSVDFNKWHLIREPLHYVDGTGMWECPDFFPVRVKSKRGSNAYNSNALSKYVLKVSLDEKRFDTYVVGKYDFRKDKFKPSVRTLDIGSALRYDYGIFYASKTFYDQHKDRRILWGWISEADTAAADISKGWASVQAIPRVIWLDESNPHALKQWPVEEVESLRGKAITRHNIVLRKDQIAEVSGSKGFQLDIEVTFDLGNSSFGRRDLLEATEAHKVEDIPENTIMYCNQTHPSAEEVLGPFGLLVLASDDLAEHTSIYFKLLRFKSGWKTLVCNDLTRSSKSEDATKAVYGSVVNVLHRQNTLSMRILIDHSILETFAEGGRACITSRAYPLLTNQDTAHLFLFNNGTTPVKVKIITVWQMDKLYFGAI